MLFTRRSFATGEVRSAYLPPNSARHLLIASCVLG